MREAFPEVGPYRYAIFDHDSKFDTNVDGFLKATGLEPKRTGLQAPWQAHLFRRHVSSAYVERLIGSIRRECLNHFIVLNAGHLKRTLAPYFLNSPFFPSLLNGLASGLAGSPYAD